jgi:hypothetical protein
VTPNQGINVGSSVAKLETFAVSKDQMNSFSNMGENKSLDSVQQDTHEIPNGSNNKDSGKKDDSASPSSDSPRTPSAESNRMVTSEDHGAEAVSSPKNAPPPAPPVAKLPPNQPPPLPPQPPKIPDKAKEAIQNQNSKTKVIVTPKPQ